MSGLYKAYKTNKDLETNGIRLEMATNDDGTIATLIVARSGGANTKFQAAITKRVKTLKGNSLINMPADAQARVMREVYAETVVLGWENVQDENGAAIPFSKDACTKLFNDLPDLFDQVVTQCNDTGNFKQSLLDDAVKN